MKQILFLITVIFLLNQTANSDAKDATPNLEEVKSSNTSNREIQSIEEITADLKARKEAAEPFKDKDVKVDIESLGLDPVDDGKKNKEKLQLKDLPPLKEDQIKVPQKEESPKIPQLIKEPKMPTPITADQNKSLAEKVTQEVKKDADKIKKDIGKIEKNVDKKAEQEGNKILSKIQNFITKAEKNVEKDVKESELDKLSKSANKSLKTLRKERLQKRIAQERKAAFSKKEKERKEAKIKRLNQLRQEYLIKLNTNPESELIDEDFATESSLITPKEKNFRWSDRFISYDPPPLPILDNYRGNDNKHIPTIMTTQEKIDGMFRIISGHNPAHFNSAYQYILDPNTRNASGETILTYATLLQKYGVMTSILAKGADPDLPNALGHTPLDIAIEMLDMKSAQILIDMNADPNYVNGLGRTYLMHAARVGFLPVVDLLISQGVDINATDNDGVTALGIAYKHRKNVIVKFLLKSGAEPWIQKPFNANNQSLIKELENRWGDKNINDSTKE